LESTCINETCTWVSHSSDPGGNQNTPTALEEIVSPPYYQLESTQVLKVR
jgi:hypothetical protein